MTALVISKIVVLTGAGISAESGLSTFRGSQGLWENHSIEDVASIDGYLRNPMLVQEFYNHRRRQLKDPKIQPNEAHKALAEFETRWPGEFLLVTQNVDNLHERAGSKNLIHMHGELMKAHCAQNGDVFSWQEDLSVDTTCPSCQKRECLRPHIVWFGEMPLEMNKIYSALDGCDLFISVGTSGQVYPAAGFVRAISDSAHSVEFNLEPSEVSSYFKEHIVGPATKTLADYLSALG